MPVLEGKTAFITGGTSGIGRATVIAFVREGANVVFVGRSEDRGAEVVRETNGAARFIRADVSNEADVERAITTTVETFGRLDVAFNNAAAVEAGTFKTLADFTSEDFDGHIALNLKSVWLCMKYQIAAMLAKKTAGSIINTSSVNGLGGVPMNALYAASKAAVIALSKSAALEYASSGIRVNALVPGAFRTPMLEGVFERVSPGDPAAAEAGYQGVIPLGRLGDPAEAANAVVWLASDASSYMTGGSLIVDGGITAPYR